jgi:glyceraldehyde 3-phosphate dehydrogenase
MTQLRVGLVGCGRIGRNLVRILTRQSGLELAAIVDASDPAAIEYLLKFDTLLGRFPAPVELRGGESGPHELEIDGRAVALLAPPESGAPDWSALGVDIVIEASERLVKRSTAEAHLAAGAERVLLCSPPVEPPDATIVIGVNDAFLNRSHRIVSAGSVTANCAAPVLGVLDRAFGIERVFLTTIHAYSNQLRLSDVPSDDMRSGRAAAENIIPQPTNADELLAELLPHLAGRISGLAMNVPVANGSIVDLACWHAREVSVQEINAAIARAVEGPLYGVLEYEDEPIVSSDILHSSFSGTFDSLSTMVIGKRVSKTLTFYDNGWGYAHRVVDLLRRLRQLDAPGEARP